jgi:hypothetical protein
VISHDESRGQQRSGRVWGEAKIIRGGAVFGTSVVVVGLRLRHTLWVGAFVWQLRARSPQVCQMTNHERIFSSSD